MKSSAVVKQSSYAIEMATDTRLVVLARWIGERAETLLERRLEVTTAVAKLELYALYSRPSPGNERDE